MSELLHVVVDNETGQELEREWYGPSAFKCGTEWAFGNRNYEISHRRRESDDTVRVFVQEVY